MLIHAILLISSNQEILIMIVLVSSFGLLFLVTSLKRCIDYPKSNGPRSWKI